MVSNLLTRMQLEGKDDDTTDRMLNPASALVGTRGRNWETANAFADWLARKDGGQQVVGQFAVNGVVLYMEAPN